MTPLLLALACGGPRLADPGEPPEVEAHARLSARSVAAGEAATLELGVTAARGWSFEAEGPVGATADGGVALVVAPLEGERAGPEARGTTRLRWSLSGPDGSYVVEAMAVRFTGPGGEAREVEVGPFYLDIGVEGPLAELPDLAQPAPPPPRPVLPVLAVAAAAVALVVVAVALRRRRPPPIEPSPAPLEPEDEALAAWAAARAAGLDDHALALALSDLFRRYLERRSGLPATRLTGPELLDALAAQPAIHVELHRRMARLLGATDLIKFARQGGGPALFDALEQDLHAALAALKPAPGVPDA